jgi:hypothetical protein
LYLADTEAGQHYRQDVAQQLRAMDGTSGSPSRSQN